MEQDKNGKQIIVRRVKKVAGRHHGGAWKVAFADFATAMMAFFLVLWLLESATQEELAAVAGYFNDPIGFSEGGSPYVIDLEGSLKENPYSGDTQVETPEAIPNHGIILKEEDVETLAREIEARKLDELKKTLEARIEQNPELNKFKDQIIMEVTREGLQIQIVDKESRPMFDSGSAVIKSYMRDILLALADTIAQVPNRISVSGHTDAHLFTESRDYSNWELSADRSNAARRALALGGVREEQLAQVVGLSSSVPFDKDDPNSPINRRISILVMNEQTDRMLKELQDSEAVPLTQEALAKPPAAGATAEQPVLNQAEAFERLRKTMTQKSGGSVSGSASKPAEPEVKPEARPETKPEARPVIRPSAPRQQGNEREEFFP